MLIPAVHKSMEHAATVTYASTASTALLLGFHASDIFMGISAGASMLGVGLQIYVAITKVRLMQRSQRWKMEHRFDKERD